MKNEIEIHIIQPERPESSAYIQYPTSISSQYLLYANESSVIPDSLDQVMKNSIIYSPKNVREEVPAKPMEPTEISAPR